MSKIIVQHTEIAVISFKEQDYICLTDMIKAKDGDFFISDWLRNRNTLEFIGIWEHLNNPDFNYGEFATIKNKSGLNNFKTSAKELIERANVVCLIAKTGRYGGTYAHKHTDAIKQNLIPPELTPEQKSFVYADEADMLNVAMFGMTARQWRDNNPRQKGNIRDYATVNQLICLSNMENLNAVFINEGFPQRERLEKLNRIAIEQMKVLGNIGERRLLK